VIERVRRWWRRLGARIIALRLELAREKPMAKRTMVDTGVGRRAVGGWWILILTGFFIVWTVGLLYAAMAFWPPTPVEGNAPPSEPIFLTAKIPMTRDQNLLLIVAILGGLGAILHVLRSFFTYAGERGLVWSWIPSYVLTPFVGAVIAVIAYVLLRAGLIGGTGSVEGNTWGFASIATLVGLFSAQATSKLKDIFETILTPVEKRSETVAAGSPPAALVDFTPKSGGAGTTVDITGNGLDAVDSVLFGGAIASPAEWRDAEQVLRTTVPGDAQTGKLKVTVDGVELESTDDFTVA